MHAGLPSISSNLPEYLSLNKEWNCGISIDNKAEELRTVLRNWLSNPSEYMKLKENAMFASRQNHWDEEKKKLIPLLNI